MASLATILLVTGYKLAKASLFIDMYKKGLNQFIPFVVTIVAIVFTDLLIGIIIGSITSIFYLLKSNFKNPFIIVKENMGDTVRIEFPNQVSFFNKASIKKTLDQIPENTSIIFDASNSHYIDFDVLEIIKEFRDVTAPIKKIHCKFEHFKAEYKIHNSYDSVPSH